MPKIPAPEDYGFATPNPSRGVVGIRPDQTGKVISSIGDALGEKVKEETNRLEDLAAQQELTALEKRRIELTYGDKGFTNVLAGDVLKRKLQDEVPAELDKAITAAEARLRSPRAKEFFKLRAAGVRNGLSVDVFRHVAAQTDHAFEQSEKDQIETAVAAVKADPSRLDEKLAEMQVLSRKSAYRTGSGQDGAAAMFGRIRQNMVVDVLQSMVAGENPNALAVKAFMDKNKEAIPEEAAKKAEGIVADKTRYKLATGLAEGLVTAYKSGTPMSEIMSSIPLQANGDEKLDKEIREQFRFGLAALKEEEEAAEGDVYGRFMLAQGLSNRRKEKAAIMASNEFINLKPDQKKAVIQYMESTINSMESHAWAAESHARATAGAKGDSLGAFARYADLYSDPNLATMDDRRIMSFAKEIGEGNTKSLLARKRELVRGASSFDFNNDQMAGALSGLKKKDADAAKGVIYSNLQAWKEANPGKVPSPEEQGALLRQSMATYSAPGLLYGTNDTPIYKLEGETDYRPVFTGRGAPVAVKKSVPLAEAKAVLRVNPALRGEEVLQVWNRVNTLPKGARYPRDFALEALARKSYTPQELDRLWDTYLKRQGAK